MQAIALVAEVTNEDLRGKDRASAEVAPANMAVLWFRRRLASELWLEDLRKKVGVSDEVIRPRGWSR